MNKGFVYRWKGFRVGKIGSLILIELFGRPIFMKIGGSYWLFGKLVRDCAK